MSKELAVPLSPSASAPSVWLRATGIVLAGSLLAAVCAHIAIPLFFTPVPLTLQPFAVLLLGLLLRPRLASATFGAYLLEGAVGLPVFAPATGAAISGLAHLFGPTGGYLLSYPLAAALISWLWRRRPASFTWAVLSAVAGDLLILACGWLWLAALTHAPQPSLAMAVFPFLPAEALKIAAAAGLAVGGQRLLRSGA